MKTALARYLEVFPGEKERLRRLGDFLRATPDPRQVFARGNFAGHITASGFVLSADRKNLALVRHNFLGRYLQPGGHVEAADANVLAAARREILEETGLRSCRHLPWHCDPLLPIDIDTHEIPANPARNEPKHPHHDFRYVFCAENGAAPHDPERTGECPWVWRPVGDAIEEETFKLVLVKLAKFPLPAGAN